MRLPRRLPFGLTAFAVAVLCPSVQALDMGPLRPYTKQTPDGKFVFVLIPPPIGVTRAEDQEIRERYPKTGLYRSDDSTAPLWTFERDFYETADSVQLASDGVHLIHSREGVSFYANGKLVRSYRVEELVDEPDRVPRRIDGSGWLERGWLDDATLEYTILTGDGNHIVFDVRTGEIISRSNPARFWRRVVACALALAIGVAGASIAVKLTRRRSRVAQPTP